LVQFDQWRTLEFLPSLKRLILAENRIKRLDNCCAVEPSEEEKRASFPRLELLDLTCNLIKAVDHIKHVFAFPALKQVTLINNPIGKAGVSSSAILGDVRLVLEKDPANPGSALLDFASLRRVPNAPQFTRGSTAALFEQALEAAANAPTDENALLGEIDFALQLKRRRERIWDMGKRTLVVRSLLNRPPLIDRIPRKIKFRECPGLNTGHLHNCQTVDEKFGPVVEAREPPRYKPKQPLKSYYRHTMSWLSKVEQVRLALAHDAVDEQPDS
jgi:hypothetical protein